MVRIVVPSIAGSAPDIIARQVAERLTAAWKQQVLSSRTAPAATASWR